MNPIFAMKYCESNLRPLLQISVFNRHFDWKNPLTKNWIETLTRERVSNLFTKKDTFKNYCGVFRMVHIILHESWTKIEKANNNQ